MNNIKDSGERQLFTTGANRDMSSNKIKISLVPVDVILYAQIILNDASNHYPMINHDVTFDSFLLIKNIYDNSESSNEKETILSKMLLMSFMVLADEYNSKNTLLYSFQEGYNFLRCPFVMERIARHYTNGAKKYGENNWRKGLPTSCYLESMMRHIVAYYQNKVTNKIDEDHASAIAFNIIGALFNFKNKNHFEEE